MPRTDWIERAGLAATMAGLVVLAAVAWCVAAPAQSFDAEQGAWARLEAATEARRDPARGAQFDALIGSLAATDPIDGLDLVLGGRERERRDPRAAPDLDVERGLLVAAHATGRDEVRGSADPHTLPALVGAAIAAVGVILSTIAAQARRAERRRIAEVCGCAPDRVRANGLAAEVARALVANRHGPRRVDAQIEAPTPEPEPEPAAPHFGRVLEISYAED